MIQGLVSGTMLAAILRVSTPVLLPAMGSLLAERAGAINVGLEGMMLTAAFAGVMTTAFGGSVWLGLAAAVGAAVALGVLLAFMHVRLGADLIIAGLALNLLASGMTAGLLYQLTGQRGSSAGLLSLAAPTLHLPFLARIPRIGDFLHAAFGQLNSLTWLALISPFLVAGLLYRTRFGLHLRACGDHPGAAAAAGLSTARVHVWALALSGVFAGLGGAFMGMGYLTLFQRDFVAGRGFIALAAPILGRGRPFPTAAAALMFGASDTLSVHLGGDRIPSHLIPAAPYLLTLLALVAFAGWGRWRRLAALRQPR